MTSTDSLQFTSDAASGLMVVLSAPSGAGKTTIAHALVRQMPQAVFSMSSTTRAPRGAERDGVDYRFLDAATFQRHIERGEFAEWAEVHGHFYGTSTQYVRMAYDEKKVVFFDIDVQGGTALKRQYPDAVLVFIVPPSLAELERRLRERGTDSDDVIRRRMLAARAEIERGAASYDYIVVNDTVERALSDVRSIIVAELRRRSRVAVRGAPERGSAAE